ncbi:hypothetical protein [Shimazuella kribbensis]|nr:hypothetical protein [Shimazuella kribbensis]
MNYLLELFTLCKKDCLLFAQIELKMIIKQNIGKIFKVIGEEH